MTKDPQHPEADNGPGGNGDTEAQRQTPPTTIWGPRQYNTAEAAILTGTDKRSLLRMLREGALKGSQPLGPLGPWLLPLESVLALLSPIPLNN